MDFFGYLDHIRIRIVEKLTPGTGGDNGSEGSPGAASRDSEHGASSVADRVSREEVRRENEHLAAELDVGQREYKKLKQIVEQLDREYEESKEVDPVRRYSRIKGMIKRTILHIHLDPDQKGSTQRVVGLVQGSKDYAQQVESQKRRGEKIANMEKEDIVAENRRMLEQIKEFRRKCSIIRDLIIQMEQGYHNSKRYVMIQRYRMIKNMVKTVIHDKLI